MAELLLELFSEEIPARMQGQAEDELAKNVLGRLNEAGITWNPGSAKTFSTPRRLALSADGLPLAQPDVTEEKRGPRVGAPEQAIQGFLKSAGLTSLEQCEKRDTGKGEFWFAVVQKKGQQTADVLPRLLSEAIIALPWPKSMRWAGYQFRWVRPLHSIVAIFDGAVIDGAVDLGGAEIQFGSITRGHRFLAPDEIEVARFADYKAKLRQSNVILEPAERRAVIEEQAEQIAQAAGYSIKPDEALLDEVTGLVEWPVVLMGRIDDAFMGIPPEVLTTTMRTNQKYFSLLEKDGRLAPRFLVVANMETADKGKAIVAGNKRVLRARLADAKFFWDQDRQVKLETRVPALKDIIFHAKLGTVADKVERIQALAGAIAKRTWGAGFALQAERAALLAKADLTSGMVGEFPELQGIMGRYYALHDGENPAVADAIADHYGPLGPSDRCPTAPVSVAVALADKIDTLVGFFTIGEKPTGSKDPYALRRAGLGIIRLIVENKLRIPLREVLRSADSEYAAQPAGMAGVFDPSSILEFLADRLKVALREKGVRHDLISAVFALGGEDDLVRLLARVDALKKFLDSDDGANLLVAYRRASNIVRIEEKKDGRSYNGGTEAALLRQDEEKALHQALAASDGTSGKSLEAEDFQGAMAALAQLRRPVDAFFDRVTVNCEEADLRANRLRLLSQIRATLGGVADFSKIEG